MEFVRLLVCHGYSPVIYQTAGKDFKIFMEGAEVVGLGGLDRHKMTRLSHKDIDKRQIRWIVYASSFVGEKNFRKGQIFIQHGIHWDYTTSLTNLRQRIKWELIRRRLSRHDLKMARDSQLTISVDSNFLNYSRVMLRHRFNPEKIRYIPNFAIPQEKSSWQGKWDHPEGINIIFARRFEFRRGVTIFADAIEQILKIIPKAKVTFAGWGSFTDYLNGKFGNSGQVKIEAVPHEQMYQLLNRSHIAIIPSTYSEGTSLSCLEAMASGCAVIATDVGGLANLVIPDYNGILIRPISSDIVSAITKLSNDMDYAGALANRAYETISHSFSCSTWQTRIWQALNEAGIEDLTH
jgi:glycosyltransferase involved in cell wall biosynthesis